MRATGFVRKTDALGRIVLPRSLRKAFGIACGDPIEMFVTDDGAIVLGKYIPKCVICSHPTDDAWFQKGRSVCSKCILDVKVF